MIESGVSFHMGGVIEYFVLPQSAVYRPMIFLYIKTRYCKYYTLNIMIMYIKIHKLSWIRNYIIKSTKN